MTQNSTNEKPNCYNSSYLLGKKLNHIRWRTEQAVLVRGGLPEGGVDALLTNLIPLVRTILEDPQAAHVEDLIIELITSWEWWTTSESIGDQAYETQKQYHRRARGEELDECFDDATKFGREIEIDVRSAVITAMGLRPELGRLIEFGGMVDQGIHPPDSMRFVYREELDPSHWSFKRSKTHRNRVAAYKFAISKRRSHLAASPNDDEGETGESNATSIDSTCPALPWYPGLPRRTRLVGQFCSEVHDLTDRRWPRIVRQQWYSLGLPTSLPSGLRHLDQRPCAGLVLKRIIRQIDDAIDAGSQSLMQFDNSRITSDLIALVEVGACPNSGVIEPTASFGELEHSNNDPPETLSASSSGPPSEVTEPGCIDIDHLVQEAETPQKKKRRRTINPTIPGEESERRVREYLKDNDSASIRRVVKKTNVPQTSVQKTDAWKTRKTRISTRDQSVPAINFRDCDSDSEIQDLGQTNHEIDVEDMEIIEASFFKHKRQDVQKYRNCESEDKRIMLFKFLEGVVEQVKASTESCKHPVEQDEYRRILEVKDLPLLLTIFDQVRDSVSELPSPGCSDREF